MNQEQPYNPHACPPVAFPIPPQTHIHYHQHSIRQKLLYITVGVLMGAYLVSGGCAPMMDGLKKTGQTLEQKAREFLREK